MKKFKVSLVTVSCLLALSISFFVFMGCEKGDGLDYDLDIPDEFQEIGKFHNEGLDFILKRYTNEIKKSREAEEFSHAKSCASVDFHSICSEATIDFCSKKKSTRKHVAGIEKLIKSGNINVITKSAKTSNMDELNHFENEIYQLIRTKYSEDDIYQLKESLNEINRQAKETLSSEEAEIVFGATSVAYSSYQYWMANYKKWYFIINYPEMLAVYTESELNDVKLKSGHICMGKACPICSLDATLDYLWNETESLASDANDAIESWWDSAAQWFSDYGDEVLDVVTSDYMGFVEGAQQAPAPQYGPLYGAGSAVLTSGEAAFNYY